MKIYRQGDVLLVRVNEVPAEAKEVKPEHGRIVLAHGEATGHTHAILDTERVTLLMLEMKRYLKVEKKVALKHEEHAPIELPPGQYEVIRQREYVPKELPRYVAD